MPEIHLYLEAVNIRYPAKDYEAKQEAKVTARINWWASLNPLEKLEWGLKGYG